MREPTTQRLALAARPAALMAGVFLAGIALIATVVPGNAATGGGTPRADVTTAVTVGPTTARPTSTSTARPTSTATSRPTTAVPTPTGPSAGPPSFPLWPAPPPSLIAPANDANAPLSSITFSWSLVPGAEQYDIEVSTSDRFTKAAQVFLQRTTSTKFTPLGQFAPGEYWWRVRGVSKVGVSNWSVVWQFRQAWLDGGAVARPTITSTAGTQAINGTQLSWTPVSGASSYEVQFSDNGNFNGSDIRFTCKTAHTILTPYGGGGVTYQGVSPGDPCNIYGTPLGDLPGTPGTPTPTPSAGQVTLSWTAPSSGGGGITGYVIQQSITNGASWVAAVPATSTETTVTINSCLRTGVPTIFRVAAVNAAGQGKFSNQSAAVSPQAAASPTPTATGTGLPTVAPPTAPSPTSTASCPTGPGETAGAAQAFRITDTVYYRVRAIQDTVGSSTGSIASVWSDQSLGGPPPGPGSFVVGSPVSGSPVAPVVMPPSEPTGNQVFSDVPVLSWPAAANPPVGGVLYKVVMATDRDFVNRITGDTGVLTQNTSLMLSQVLVDNNTESYYWFVLACRVGIDGAASCPPDRQAINQPGFYGTFRKIGPQVSVPSGQPRLQRANVTMTWSPVSAASATTASYLLQVSQNQLFEPEVTGVPIIEEVSTDNTSYTVIDQTKYPDGPYYWRVAAVDEAGQALPWSKVQSFKKQTTTAPPPNFLTLTPTSKGFRATWSAPSTDNGSTITNFRLSWRKTAKNTWQRFVVGPSIRALTMTGLAPRQPVQVVLQSLNGKGWGPASPVKTTTTTG